MYAAARRSGSEPGLARPRSTPPQAMSQPLLSGVSWMPWRSPQKPMLRPHSASAMLRPHSAKSSAVPSHQDTLVIHAHQPPWSRHATSLGREEVMLRTTALGKSARPCGANVPPYASIDLRQSDGAAITQRQALSSIVRVKRQAVESKPAAQAILPSPQVGRYTSLIASRLGTSSHLRDSGSERLKWYRMRE